MQNKKIALNKSIEGNQPISKENILSQKQKSDFNVFGFTEKFDDLNSPSKLAKELQGVVDKFIDEYPNADWREDYISLDVIRAIRFILGRYVIPNVAYASSISKFDVEAYKLSGAAEQTHGDIAIVVSRSFGKGGCPVSGVGFYEAKASDVKRGGYRAFSIQQLRRLVTNTPKLSYLLYDKIPQIADIQEWPILQEYKDQTFGSKRFHARTVDANFLKQYKSLGEAAYFVSQSFGYHFVYKILSGRELDYSRPVTETIRRWLKTTRWASPYVISIAIQEEKTEPIESQLQLPGFEKLLLEDYSSSDGAFKLPDKQLRLANSNDVEI